MTGDVQAYAVASNAAPLRVGVIGYGLGGSVFHAPLVAATAGLQLAAVVTRDAERGRRAVAAYPGVQIVQEAAALWDGSAGLAPVDLVVVTTPNATHVPLATAAIGAGRHVVVDKPLAATADEAERLADAARVAGVVLVPFHNRRWDGDFRTVQRLIADGALGIVQRLESRFDRWRPTPRAGWKEVGGAGQGTGLLYDLGTHLVDQALVLFGPVVAVYAERDRRRAGAPGSEDVDDDVFVALTHASGVRSHLMASALTGQAGARFRVMGSAGAYVKFGLDPQEAALSHEAGAPGARPGMAGWGADPEAAWGTLGAGDTVRVVPTEVGAYEQFYAGVRATIREGAQPPVRVEDAIAGLRILEAAHEAAANARVVRLA